MGGQGINRDTETNNPPHHCNSAVVPCPWVHGNDYDGSNNGPNDQCRCILHEVDAYWHLFLAAMLVSWMQRKNLNQGRSLQPGPGGQQLQRIRW